MRLFLSGLLLAAVLGACGGSDEPDRDDRADRGASRPTAAPTPRTDANGDAVANALYVFDCGTIEIADLDPFAADGSYAGAADTFTDSCFLVRHAGGDLLWDLGLPAGLVTAGPESEGIFTLSLQRTLTDQLADLGMTPDDIEFVAISHGHFDHAGQPEAAGDAVWIVQEEELAVLEGENPPVDLSAFAGFERMVVSGDHDVFGDGAVRIVDLPGHTPGHSGLLVNLAETGPVLLTGDLYHRAESRGATPADSRVPRFNTSEDQTRSSMARFEALASATGARVVIQHEPRDIDALPEPPEALN